MNLNKLIVILSLQLLISCSVINYQNAESFLLRWSLPETKTIQYHTYLTSILTPDDDRYLHVDGFELLNNPELYQKTIDRLTSIPINETPFVSTISRQKDVYRTKTEIAEATYTTKPRNESEEDFRRIYSRFIGDLISAHDFASSGALHSFYIKREQKNTAILFYQLPQTPVAVGDTWTLPVQLIGLDEGYFPTDTTVKNQNKLEKIWVNADGDRVARISSVIAEKVKAFGFINNNSERVDIRFEMYSIGYSDFLIDKGYLLKSVRYGIWDFDLGKHKQKTSSLYGLEYMPQ